MVLLLGIEVDVRKAFALLRLHLLGLLDVAGALRLRWLLVVSLERDSPTAVGNPANVLTIAQRFSLHFLGLSLQFLILYHSRFVIAKPFNVAAARRGLPLPLHSEPQWFLLAPAR